MRARISAVVLASLVLLGFVVPARADGLIIPIPSPIHPEPPLRSLTIKYHRVTVTIDGQVATTHVDQVFVNEGAYDIEGEYIFPLPQGASVSQFAMWVDGDRLEAEVLDGDEARSIYEEIVRQRRDPALLEYVGRGAFRARIYPIPARGEKRVEMEYTEVLPADHGLVRYVYPLNTEKFSARPLEEVSVTIEIVSPYPLKTIYSPSHEIAVRREGELVAQVVYQEEDILPTEDFLLYYGANEQDLGLNLMAYREDDQDGFFLCLLAPKPQVDEVDTVAKDVFFVLDISGSMRGEKLKQAKDAVEYVLDNLNHDDRFNIVAFSTGTRSFADHPRPGEDAPQAETFVSGLRAGGGTDIGRALEETMAQTTEGRPQFVILLTDGLATEGEKRTEKIVERVNDLASGAVRIFAFGVGYEVNTLLLDTISQRHHGTSVYVRPDEELEGAISSFYEKISRPVLADVSVQFGDVRVEDSYPYPLPDLFAGSQIVLVGRYRNPGDTTLTLRGTANGRPVSYVFEDVRFQERGGADFIPRLWATRKIGHLLTQIRLEGADKELVDEVIALSVRYGIVTPYTSFLIDETEDALTADGRRVLAERELASQPDPGVAPASGAGAVEKAIVQGSLREADVAVRPEGEVLRTVGAKAFVLHNGIWTDTTFDASEMLVERVPFGSEGYFELLEVSAEWGRYLALGRHVIVVAKGRAFQIVVDESGQSETLRPEPAYPVLQGHAPSATSAAKIPLAVRALLSMPPTRELGRFLIALLKALGD